MIYSFVGSDREKIRAHVTAWIAAARKKEPNLTYIRMTGDSFNEALFQESLEGQSLFAKKILIALDEVLTEHDLEGAFQAMKESENVFVIIETKIASKIRDSLQQLSERQFHFERKDGKGTEDIFAVGNALARRDAKGVWVAYQEARFRDDPPQQVFGIVHAKIRKLLREGSRHYSRDELEKLSYKCITALQESRQGVWSPEDALEYFLLSI